MKKWHLADTNVLFNKPEVLLEYNVVIPSHVLREVEHLELTRKQDRLLQFQIRRFKNFLDENEHLHVDLKDYKFNLRDDWDGNYTDNILVQICVEEGYGLLSNDRLLKDKCRLYDIEVVDLQNSNFIENKGFKEINMHETQLLEVYYNLNTNWFDMHINEYVAINNVVDGEILDVMKWDGTQLVTLRNEKGELGTQVYSPRFDWLIPKDEYQVMAIDSILSNQLTSIRGRAGSGKSLISLHTAWHLVETQGYKMVMFVNPASSKDAEELGFYKGDRLAKLLQSSVGATLISKFGDEFTVIEQVENGLLQILPFSDLRGFDTGESKVIVWILEAQNLTKELLKLGLQRIGENTKVIVDGDYHAQIDKGAYESDNGMKRMSEIFRGDISFGEIELQNVWRSRLAEMADLM